MTTQGISVYMNCALQAHFAKESVGFLQETYGIINKPLKSYSYYLTLRNHSVKIIWCPITKKNMWDPSGVLKLFWKVI